MVLKELCALRGISGSEDAVRAVLMDRARQQADEVFLDRMGNLMAIKHAETENAPRVLLVAHMDEPGLMIKGIEDNGLLAITPIGHLDARDLVSKRVSIGEKALPGVIGAKAIHLQTAEDRRRAPEMDKLYIDIGAKDAESSAKLVERGESASLDAPWLELGNGLVRSRALPARIGCALLLSLLEEAHACELICAFTVQHELGFGGAECVAYNQKPDAVIVLDAAEASDMGGTRDERLTGLQLGKGPAIAFMDGWAAAGLVAIKRLHALAGERNIPVQSLGYIAQSEAMGRFRAGYNAIPAALLASPVRYLHSVSPLAAFADMEALYGLLEASLQCPSLFRDDMGGKQL